MSDLTQNLAKAEAALSRFKRDGVLNQIGGEQRMAASGGTFESVSPVDGSTLAPVAKGGAEDVDAAVRAATAAFAEWRDMPGKARREILHRVADGIVARAEEEGNGFFDALVEAGREVERRAKDKAPRVGELKERVRHHTGETMDRMEKAFDDRLGKALSRLGIPNKREVDPLRQRVQELTDALDHIDKDDQDPPTGR